MGKRLKPGECRCGLSTELLRPRIAEAATQEEVERIAREFVPALDPRELAGLMRDPKNWKRGSKNRVAGNVWERMFDCRPLDDQLRCYVQTDPQDTEVLLIRFQTE